MSIRFSLGASVAVMAATLIAPPAAWGQALTAKDAWEALNAFVSGAGGTLATTGLQREGDAMIARRVTFAAGDALTLAIDEVRLEPRGDQVAIIPSATFLGNLANVGLNERRSYAIAHDGQMMLSLTPEEIGVTLDFNSFQITKTLAQRQGTALDETFEGVLTGLAGRIGVTLADPVDLSGRLTATSLDYRMRTNDTQFIPIQQDGRSENRDLVLEFNAAGLALMDGEPGFVRRAFDGGFSVRLLLESGTTRSTVSQTINALRTDFGLAAGGSTLTITAADGEVALSTGISGLEVTVNSPLAGSATAEGLSFGMSLPVVATDTDRPFSLSSALSEVRISRELLNMLGAGDFSDDVVTMELEARADGRWLVEITDDPSPDLQPVDFSTFSLVNLLTRVGESALSGSGTYTLAPGAIAAAGDGPPDGEGRFQFDLRGGEALLNRLGAIGLIPPDQQFLARMMMNGLGRSVGPDHLQSDVVIARGGVVTVNGMPLPF